MRQREAQLNGEIAALVDQAEAQDATDDATYGVASDGYSVAEELAPGQTWLLPASASEAWLEPRGGLGVLLSTLPPGLSPGALLQSPSGLGILEPLGRSE